MSEMIFSTNILLINAKKCVESWRETAKPAKNHKIHVFVSLTAENMGLQHFFPQKGKFTSEMIVPTNILLVNDKKCEESCKKQQKYKKKYREKPCFFVFNC